jgi:hypothetical protein
MLPFETAIIDRNFRRAPNQMLPADFTCMEEESFCRA